MTASRRPRLVLAANHCPCSSCSLFDSGWKHSTSLLFSSIIVFTHPSSHLFPLFSFLMLSFRSPAVSQGVYMSRGRCHGKQSSCTSLAQHPSFMPLPRLPSRPKTHSCPPSCYSQSVPVAVRERARGSWSDFPYYVSNVQGGGNRLFILWVTRSLASP